MALAARRLLRHTWHSLEYIFGFLLMTTWLNPILLILSLAANEQTLPGGGGSGPYGSGGGSGAPFSILATHGRPSAVS